MQLRLILILLFFGTRPIAQVKTLPPILEKLASFQRPVICFSLNNHHLLNIPDLPENFKNSGQNVLKTKDRIYLQIDGTGRLYRLDSSLNGFKWTRIDSTYFSGYNFGAVNFTLDTNFYSFGGNGYWMVNGILRYFNPKSKEWNLLPCSDPIYFSKEMNNGNDHFYFLDTSSYYLYFQGINFSHQTIANPFKYAPNKNMLFKLNIHNGVYDTIGRLTDSAFHFMGTTPWGALVNNGKVIDVKNNIVYQLSRAKKNEIIALKENSTSRNNYAISFFVDSMLYIGNYENKIDSMKINFKDLIKEEAAFYTPLNSNATAPNINEKNMIIIVLVIIIIYLLVMLLGKRGKTPLFASIGLHTSDKIEEQHENGNPVSFRSSKVIELLEQRERDLLSFIYKQSAEERLTSIEEINKVIGAAQRTPEIQKRLRSDLIIAINEKLSIVSKSKKSVIEKQRSEFDKRSFEYFIQPEFMELVRKIVE